MKWLKFSVIACAIVACSLSFAAGDRSNWTPTQNPSLLRICQESVDSKKERYKALINEKKYLEAANVLEQCRYVWPTNEIDKLAGQAEIQNYVSIIKDPKTNAFTRDQTLYSLRSNHPETVKLFPKDYARLDREDRAQEARNNREERRLIAEEAKKPKYDIKLGMLSMHVLTSKWGAPQKVNKSIDAGGTHEQWVYGNNRYLYFDNDRLSAIQTSKVTR